MSTVGRGDQKRRRTSSPAERIQRDFDEVDLELPRRRSRLARPLLLLAFCAGGLFALPMVLGTLGLHNWLLARAVGIQGTVRAESASFGWLSPVVLRDVQIRDAEGETIVKIDAVSGTKSLLGLAFGPADLGRFTITHPVVRVAFDEHGSNIEQVLQPLLSGSSASSHPRLAVVVEDGILLFDDRQERRKYEIDTLALDLSMGGEAAPLALKASGQLRSDSQPAAIELELATQPGATLFAAGDARWNFEDLPLELLQPLVRRYLVGAVASGSLTMNGRYVWGLAGGLEDTDRAERAAGEDAGLVRRRAGDRHGDGLLSADSEFRGRCAVRDLAFQSPQLGSDRIELERVTIPCQFVRRGAWMDVEKLAFESDLGELTVSGRVPLSSLAAANLSAAADGESLQLDGQFDLARIARLLPQTLRLRDGTELVGGDLKLALRSQPSRDGVAIEGRIEADNLAARANGRRLSWREPFVATLSARQTAAGPVIDALKCTSSFLQIAGEGTPDELDASAQFDLAVLMDELAKFLDLGGIDLAGAGEAELHLKRSPHGGFTATVDFQARQFQWIRENRRPWREPEIALRLDLAGSAEAGALRDIQRASLNVDAGAEQLNVQLAEPLEHLDAARWPLELAWKGQLAEWLPRIESWAPLEGWDVAGVGTATANLVWSQSDIAIRQANVDLRNFRALAESWNIDEPRVELAIAGVVSPARNELTIDQGDLVARDLKLRADKVRLASGRQTGTLAEGALTFQADLAQLAAWRQPARAPRRVELAGVATGNADVQYARGQTQAQVNMSIQQLRLADTLFDDPRLRRPRDPAQHAVWQERKLDLVAKASYDAERDRLDLERIELAGEAIRAALAGAVVRGQRQHELDLAGRLEFDWQRLAPLWRQFLPREIDLAGRESREFRVHGPWRADAPTLAAALAGLEAEGGLGWSAATFYGLPVGETTLQARLDRGRVQIQPLAVPISGGHLALAPLVKLAPEPAELQLPAGRVADRIQLTPDVCRRGLKFVAPVLAEVTQADGQFSVDVEGARFPLADPIAGEAVGAVALSAQVRPGPIVEQLLLLVREVEHLAKGNLNPPTPRETAFMVMNDERIDFKMIDRRIYHQSLQFKVGSTEIVTRGSVGLDDESLAILAQVKVSPQVTLDLPIQGTLSDFQIDRRALGRQFGKSVEGAVKGLLLDQLDKGLERLLPPGNN